MRHFAVPLLLAAAVWPLCAQTSDTTPPHLVSFSFSPSTVDVSSAAKTVTVNATITDDLSGFAYGYVYFTSPRGQYAYFYFSRLSGDALSGTYRATGSIPVYGEQGIWKATVYVWDNAGNRLTLNPAALTPLGFATDLNVVDTTADTLPPTLLSATFAPNAIDVSSGSADVAINLHITDNLSGAWNTSSYWFAMYLRAPGNAGNANIHYVTSPAFHLVSGTVFDGVWQAVTTMPRYSPAGVWTIQTIYLYDNVGNYIYLGPTQLAAAGINAALTVTASPSDTQAPILTGLAFTPPLFNTSAGAQTVTMALSATDDLSGVAFGPTTRDIALIEYELISPSGNQYQYVSPWTPPVTVGGTPLAGTWQLSFTFPRYSEEGTWKVAYFQLKDAAGNTRNYTAQMLQSMGLPFTVVVTKPSLVTDGTVGPAGGTVTDNSFGSRASITFPSGVAPANTSVSIDVFATPLAVPTPTSFTQPGTYFTNISFSPPLLSPLPSPGITVVLPLLTPMVAGAHLTLFHIDPVSGILAPAMNAFHQFVVGTVNSDNMSVTFNNVVTLSTVVGYLSNGSVMGDVDGSGAVTCTDVSLIRASFGKRTGQPGFNLAADVNNDGVVDIRDLFVVTRQLPTGTTCQ